MLTCVYHPIDPFRVVEEDEAARLKASGVWFDCPKKAKEYREQIEEEIKEESKALEAKDEKRIRKVRGKSNERKQDGAI